MENKGANMDRCKLPVELVDKVIADIERFLTPLLSGLANRTPDRTLTEVLVLSSPNPPAVIDNGDRAKVLVHAGDLLLSLDIAVEARNKEDGAKKTYLDSAAIKLLLGLIDLLFLEGVYPGMSSGICSPSERQARSVLYPKGAPPSAPPKDLGYLEIIAYNLLGGLVIRTGSGIQPYIRGQNLQDVVAANGDLAFTRWRTEKVRSEAEPYFQTLMTMLPVDTLYLILSRLARSRTAPGCFQQGIRRELALLPRRPNGVRHCIEFIAASHSPAATQPSAGHGSVAGLSKELKIEMNALDHMSRVLSAVPAGMSPDKWVRDIGEQLLDLVDGEAGEEMAKVAGYIIGHGILGKRELGGYGKVGWKIFIESVHLAINPVEGRLNFENDPIVTENDLRLAVRQLAPIFAIHPHHGLVGRLIRPILLPLWALANYDKSVTPGTYIQEAAFALLELFQRRAGSLQTLRTLSSRIMWDGPAEWTFGPGSEGGIAIRSRKKYIEVADPLQLLRTVSRRVASYTRLLSAADVDRETLGSLFLEVTQQWLLKSRSSIDEVFKREHAPDPVEHLIVAKLAQIMLEHFQDKIASNPVNILELILQLLKQQVQQHDEERTREKALQTPNLAALSDIVHEKTDVPAPNDAASELSDPNDIINISLSLLSALIRSPEFKRDARTQSILQGVLGTLQELLPGYPTTSTMSQRIHQVLNDVESITTQSQESSRHTPALSDPFEDIQTNVASDLAPVRASAISSLREIIRSNELVLDIHAAALLLLHTIRTDTEEYVYLAAIATLVDLAKLWDIRAPTQLTIEAFQDLSETADVDGRLRVGEALSELVAVYGDPEYRGQRWVSKKSILDAIMAAVISVAGRRGMRTKEREERVKAELLEKAKQREAKRAWGGEVPQLPEVESPDEDHSTRTPEAKQKQTAEREAIASIIKEWQDTGVEEDVRIRTSALSILGRVIELGLGLLDSVRLDLGYDLAICALLLEPQPGKSILRRAAVHVFISLVRAFDKINDSRDMDDKVLTVNLNRLDEIEKVLEYVKDMDDDELTKAHATTALENLEAWKIKHILKINEANLQQALTPRLGLEGGLQGLDINPQPQKSKGSGRPMIVEFD